MAKKREESLAKLVKKKKIINLKKSKFIKMDQSLSEIG